MANTPELRDHCIGILIKPIIQTELLASFKHKTKDRALLAQEAHTSSKSHHELITLLFMPLRKPKPENPKPPVLMPNREKPSTLVLTVNQETCASRLLTHGANHTQCHPTYQPSTNRVSNLCLTFSGPLLQVSYSCHDPCCCPPCHTCHLHTLRQANVILHTRQIEVEPPKSPEFKFKPRQVNYSSQSEKGSEHLVSQSPAWWVHWQQKAQGLNFKSKTHEAQLEDQKAKEWSRRSSRRRANHKASKWHEMW
jgi:hypothetical protein